MLDSYVLIDGIYQNICFFNWVVKRVTVYILPQLWTAKQISNHYDIGIYC